MRLRLLTAAAGLLTASAAFAQQPLPLPAPLPSPAPAAPQARPLAADPAPQPGVKVEDHGPIHEGFAQPGAQTRGKNVTAPKAPPPDVPELPPDQKPAGDNVRWVPGYWHYD